MSLRSTPLICRGRSHSDLQSLQDAITFTSFVTFMPGGNEKVQRTLHDFSELLPDLRPYYLVFRKLIHPCSTLYFPFVFENNTHPQTTNTILDQYDRKSINGHKLKSSSSCLVKVSLIN